MKNTLAENMLRFGVKNLQETEIKKIEKLAEQGSVKTKLRDSIANDKKLLKLFNNILMDPSTSTSFGEDSKFYIGSNYIVILSTTTRHSDKIKFGNSCVFYEFVYQEIYGGPTSGGNVIVPFICLHPTLEGVFGPTPESGNLGAPTVLIWDKLSAQPIESDASYMQGKGPSDKITNYINSFNNTNNVPENAVQKLMTNIPTIFGDKFQTIKSNNTYKTLVKPYLKGRSLEIAKMIGE